MVEEKRVPTAVHEDQVANETKRFIHYYHTGSGVCLIYPEATTKGLREFSEHFGKPIRLVAKTVNIIFDGDNAKQYQKICTFEGVLIDADQRFMDIGVQRGQMKDRLGDETELSPGNYKIGYGYHQSNNRTRETESVQIEAVIVNGENIIPDFNPALGGQTILESFLEHKERMKRDSLSNS